MLCKTQLLVLNRSANSPRRSKSGSPRFFSALSPFSSAFLKVYALVSVASARYWFATRESTRGMTFAAPPLLLHPPFVSPLNYLRALRDWPTNPVRLNNLPIIRGPLCFIRRVSNKSHCVFRRAASNSIRVRTRTLSAYPASKKKKRAKRRNGRGSDRRDREGRRSRTIRTNWLEIRLNIANLWRSREGEQYPPILHNAPAHKYC